VEFVQVCQLRLCPGVVHQSEMDPPSTAEIVGWIVGEGRGSDLKELVPDGITLICYMVSYHGGWKS
jgi:hypothetical protein